MDTELDFSGDLKEGEDGAPCTVTGTDELRQRLYIMLSARRGQFIYDRELGSDIYLVKDGTEDEICAAARDALASLPEAEVTGVTKDNNDIYVAVVCGSEEFDIRVRV